MMHQTRRFTILDGMRGIAAVAVVLGHAAGQIEGVDLLPNIGLAVPFFFMLSGFVLSYAYRKGLDGRKGIATFAKQRVIRLFPLIVLSALLGSAVLAYRFFAGDLQDATPVHVMISQVMSLTTLPTPFLTIDNWRWPVNQPQWSLFYELLASAALAFGLLNANKRNLVSVSATGFAICAFLGFTKGLIAPGLLGQVALTAFSFPLGCLIFNLYKNRTLPTLNVPLPAIVGLTFVLFYPGEINYQLQLLILLLGVPLVICSCLGPQPTGKASKVMEYAGEMSYPIYILHWPILISVRQLELPLTVPALTVVVLITSVAVAHFALMYIDTPVRRMLRRRYLKPANANTTIPPASA